MRCTFLLIVLGRTASTDYTATSFLFHTPEISIALPMDGRALTIYEKAYPESELNTDKAHREFIEELSYC